MQFPDVVLCLVFSFVDEDTMLSLQAEAVRTRHVLAPKLLQFKAKPSLSNIVHLDFFWAHSRMLTIDAPKRTRGIDFEAALFAMVHFHVEFNEYSIVSWECVKTIEFIIKQEKPSHVAHLCTEIGRMFFAKCKFDDRMFVQQRLLDLAHIVQFAREQKMQCIIYNCVCKQTTTLD